MTYRKADEQEPDPALPRVPNCAEAKLAKEHAHAFTWVASLSAAASFLGVVINMAMLMSQRFFRYSDSWAFLAGSVFLGALAVFAWRDAKHHHAIVMSYVRHHNHYPE